MTTFFQSPEGIYFALIQGVGRKKSIIRMVNPSKGEVKTVKRMKLGLIPVSQEDYHKALNVAHQKLLDLAFPPVVS